MEFEHVLIFLTVSVTSVNFVAQWYLSRGRMRLVYWLNLYVYAGFAATEALMAAKDPENWSLYLYTTVDMWAFGMAVVGLRRLNAEKEPHLK